MSDFFRDFAKGYKGVEMIGDAMFGRQKKIAEDEYEDERYNQRWKDRYDYKKSIMDEEGKKQLEIDNEKAENLVSKYPNKWAYDIEKTKYGDKKVTYNILERETKEKELNFKKKAIELQNNLMTLAMEDLQEDGTLDNYKISASGTVMQVDKDKPVNTVPQNILDAGDTPTISTDLTGKDVDDKAKSINKGFQSDNVRDIYKQIPEWVKVDDDIYVNRKLQQYKDNGIITATEAKAIRSEYNTVQKNRFNQFKNNYIRELSAMDTDEDGVTEYLKRKKVQDGLTDREVYELWEVITDQLFGD